MCIGYETPTFELLCSHIMRNHSNSPNFSLTCGYDGCMRTLSSFSAFKKHIQRNHKQKVSFSASNPIDGNGVTSTIEEDMDSDHLGM